MTEPALSIHTSNRLDVLVEHLAGVFAAEPLPTLEREVIIVQSQGMVRWLTLQLADRSGLAASLTMPFPGSFCRQLAERLEGDDPAALTTPAATSEHASAFDREPLTWRIFDRLRDAATAGDNGTATASGATPATYLEEDPDQIKRYQLSVRLAGLFEGYQLFRPRMLLDWEAGDGAEATPEGEAADHAGWQSELWRALAAGDAGDVQEDHLARRSVRLLELLHHSSRPPDGLPRRLSVFGASTLPPIFLQVAVALAKFIPVRIYLVSPTYQYWGELRSEREAARIRKRRDGPTARTRDGEPGDDDHLGEDHFDVGHPLLAAFGRQGRDFFNLLQEADALGAAWHELELVDPGDGSLLHALQSDVLHLVDRGGPEAPPRRLDAGDDSLRVHACHSPMREMEVLRDQLFAAFEADPTLEPSDVLVMMPRIGDYSPYVEAAFAMFRSPSATFRMDSTPMLPFMIADREAGDQRPAAATVLRLLELVGSRLTSRAVLDLLDTAAVRRAFGIAATDVPALRRWAHDTRIRWGMDGTQRAADFAVPEVGGNTWQAGLDRLLMGYAAGDDDELVAGIAPHAGQAAGNAQLLGRLAAFTDTLFGHLRRLRDPRPADAWAADLRAALADLFQVETEDEDSAFELVLGVLEELHQVHSMLRALGEPLSRQVVHAHLRRRLAAEGAGGGFLSGRITFCALKPMRAIPFKVICVAGLGEGAFPRRDPRPGFDLMATGPRPGDRSLAEDDRYLFLETLLAAGDRLILTYQGRSQKDNSRQAPSAVISELLAYLDRAFVSSDGRPARELVVVEHRLHPWNPAYYGASGDPRLFSYSRQNFLLGDGDRRPAALPFVAADGEATEPEGELDVELHDLLEVDLDDLVELWINPAKHYCRKVLQLTLTEHRESDDAEPFDVDFLDRYRISQWLLRRRLRELPAGRPRSRAGEDELELLRARGELPLAGLGAVHYSRLSRRVDDFVATLPPHQPREPIPIELAGDGWRLAGRLEELTDAGALRFRCANLKPKDLVRAWVTHVAFAAREARDPTGLPLSTHLAGIDRGLRFGALDDAAAILDSLIAGYRAGLERPLPLFEHASSVYVETARRQSGGGRSKITPKDAAYHAFRGDRRPGGKQTAHRPGDAADPYVALCFRDRDPLAENGFARWAETLWTPLFDHAEEVNQ